MLLFIQIVVVLDMVVKALQCATAVFLTQYSWLVLFSFAREWSHSILHGSPHFHTILYSNIDDMVSKFVWGTYF